MSYQKRVRDQFCSLLLVRCYYFFSLIISCGGLSLSNCVLLFEPRFQFMYCEECALLFDFSRCSRPQVQGHATRLVSLLLEIMALNEDKVSSLDYYERWNLGRLIFYNVNGGLVPIIKVQLRTAQLVSRRKYQTAQLYAFLMFSKQHESIEWPKSLLT
jgi:hypothetical protein